MFIDPEIAGVWSPYDMVAAVLYYCLCTSWTSKRSTVGEYEASLDAYKEEVYCMQISMKLLRSLSTARCHLGVSPVLGGKHQALEDTRELGTRQRVAGMRTLEGWETSHLLHLSALRIDINPRNLRTTTLTLLTLPYFASLRLLTAFDTIG